VGVRHLSNGLTGLTGYRTDNYLYVPFGLTARTDAVTQLTQLFEQAKFSRHDVDDAMKQRAIDSLRVIRDDLRSVPA